MTALAEPSLAAPAAGGSRPLAGTASLLRLAVRTDRIMIPVWLLVNAMMVLSMPNTLNSMYGTAAQRAELVRSMTANGSMRAMLGPIHNDGLGGLTVWRVGTFAGLIAAAMSLLIVIRHTRDEEETGRQEVIASAAVGRHAPLTAALLTAAAANAVLALLITGGLSAQGSAGALAFGLAVAGLGMVFATVAAIAAQLTESARLARGLTAALLGAAFLLRAAGDSGSDDGSSVLTWLSPIGWLQNTRAFAAERWWVLLLFALAVAAQAALAYGLAGRRDLGMSFLPTRPGPARGRLGTAGALAWRLQRGSVLGWSLGFLLAGLVFGGMTGNAADLIKDNESAREIFQRMGGQSGLTDAFLASMVAMLGLVGALYVVSSVLRLNGEENAGRVEWLLAAPVSRLRWAGGHLVIAFGGSALLMVVGALGLILGYRHDAGPILAACLVQLAAIWTIGGFAVLLLGVLPRAALASWAVAGAALLLGWVGPALKLPQSVLDLSPYAHLPRLPGAGMSWPPVLLLLLIAAAFTTTGLAALRRRDLSN
ncbi:ABC transporter permease [Streptomyces sp. NPDC058045]|uniref:ABC transporter permease n=1 Tax=Streptomyces sp. NPDC058045 TaxID=3346311 RepID=UPI0036EC6DED